MATSETEEIRITWEPRVAEMVKEQLAAHPEKFSERPMMVALVGIPGTGKTTGAKILKYLIPNSVIVPADGFHYYVNELKAMEDPDQKIYLRGIPATFNAAKLMSKLNQVRNDVAVKIVSFPSFDHAVGDPNEDTVVFDRRKHQVLLVEGLYMLYDKENWAGILKYWDLKVFIESNLDACVERLKERNKCIPGYTEEEIAERCEIVDRSNGRIIISTMDQADVVVQGSSMS